MTSRWSVGLVCIVACSPAPPRVDAVDPTATAEATAVAPAVGPSETWSLQTLDYHPGQSLLQLLPNDKGGTRVAVGTLGRATTLVLESNPSGGWTAFDTGRGTGIESGVYLETSKGPFLLTDHGDDGDPPGVFMFGLPGLQKGKRLDEAPKNAWTMVSSGLPASDPWVCWTGADGKKTTGAKVAFIGADGWTVRALPIDEPALCAIAAIPGGGAWVVASTQIEEVFVVRIDPAGVVGAPLSAGPGRWPGAVVGPDGDLRVAVSRKDGLYFARVDPKSPRFDFTKIREDPGYEPTIRVADDGTVRISRVLYGADPTKNQHVVVNTSAKGGAAPWTSHDFGSSISQVTALSLDATQAKLLFVATTQTEKDRTSRLVLATTKPPACKGTDEWCNVSADLRAAAAVCAEDLTTPARTEALAARAFQHCSVASAGFSDLAEPLAKRCAALSDVGLCTLYGLLRTDKEKVSYNTLKILEPRKCEPKTNCRRAYQVKGSHLELRFAGAAPNPEPAREALVRACDKGGGLACEMLAFADEPTKPEAASERALAACRGGRPIGCGIALRIAQKNGTLAKAGELLGTSREVFTRACETGDGPSCVNAGFLLEEGLGQTKDVAAAAKLYRYACELDEPDPHACERMIALKSRAAAAFAKVDWADVADTVDQGCQGGDPDLCLTYADALDKGIGVKRDAARAKKLRAETCEDHKGFCD